MKKNKNKLKDPVCTKLLQCIYISALKLPEGLPHYKGYYVLHDTYTLYSSQKTCVWSEQADIVVIKKHWFLNQSCIFKK